VTESRLQLYNIFHLNLAYSSIEEEQRTDVIQRCYWPLLQLAREHNLPLGIEASGYTLETTAVIDPAWVEELRSLTSKGPCEFVGSGYAQIIGPLVPAEVNAANLRLGHQVYERLLGFRPEIALVNEQAYSAGLVKHYLGAEYRAIVMEWDNPARYHPEWTPEWRYLPQFACGQLGEEIPLIWNKSIAFQKFQRYSHKEIELDEYLDYLCQHLAETPRAFPLYGNDVEIFDFRPGRYHTEAALSERTEWSRIDALFEALGADNRFRFIRPSQVLELMQVPGAGNRLSLESPEQPITVKKQGKYNIARWAVTGCDNVSINSACWRIYEALRSSRNTTDRDWRELCYLWSSDFRTHITEKRWRAYRKRLLEYDQSLQKSKINVVSGSSNDNGQSPIDRPSLPMGEQRDRAFGPLTFTHQQSLIKSARVERSGRYLIIETDTVKLRLNCQRGLAIDALWFKDTSNKPLCGTLQQGYYDDINWGADFYTGHLILEQPGQPKVTDLNPVEPQVIERPDFNEICVIANVQTTLGPVEKHVRLSSSLQRIELSYDLKWDPLLVGSLRVAHVTLNPDAFARSTLFYATHNGGSHLETFPLQGRGVDHGSPVSFLVSASHGLGLTAGYILLGNQERQLRVDINPTVASLLGMVTYCPVGQSYFCRLSLSAREIDDTLRAYEDRRHSKEHTFSVAVSPIVG
jgi:hypothetical protein